jgi:NAD(P)-dependent dehydrogenase (short-subunit alcohol dehydrogenase family)
MLENKIALITGGATGIGKASWTAYGQNRAKVAIASVIIRTSKKLPRTPIKRFLEAAEVTVVCYLAPEQAKVSSVRE